MNEVIPQAKAEFLRAKERIAHILATTPNDKVNWSPSPTARTPIESVAHAALAVQGIQGLLTGKPFPYDNMTVADAAFREAEKEFTTREQVLTLLEKNSADYLTFLDKLTPEQLASTLQTPFGPIPMTVGITLPADHTRFHSAQIEYVQTIYGDRDWHM